MAVRAVGWSRALKSMMGLIAWKILCCVLEAYLPEMYRLENDMIVPCSIGDYQRLRVNIDTRDGIVCKEHRHTTKHQNVDGSFILLLVWDMFVIIE
jgi:hypothetical protein